MKYLVLFVCSMIIPAMNTSAVSIALSNNIVDLIFYIIDFGVFRWGIQRLKEKDEALRCISLFPDSQDRSETGLFRER